MLRPFSYLTSSKVWFIGLPASLLLLATIASYTVLGSDTRPKDEQTPLGEGQELVSVQKRTFIKVVPVKGSLVFPNTAELTFDTRGKVGEILVHAGQRVVKGQLLAKLDRIAVANLREDVARARFELDQAQDALERAKEEFITTPMERAEFEAEIAQAGRSLEDAAENLADFQRDYRKDLTTATKAKVDAELVLDDALEQLGYYDRDQAHNLAAALDEVSAKELAMDKAKQSLANFEADFEESLGDALVKKGNAEAARDVAEDSLTAFFINPTRNIQEGELIDVEILRRRQATLREAESNLDQAEVELADLQANKDLDLQERETAVALVEAELVEARDDLIVVEDTVDQTLELQERLAAVEDAEAKLAQVVKDLEDEIDGPDQAELAVREKAFEVAREKLADLTDGPDLFEVAVKEAAVASAQAQVDDALEELAGATVRAPFDGIVRLINVDIDDMVSDESRVIEIVDPTAIQVDGLVDAANIQFVRKGSMAKVSIDALAGQVLEVTVSSVAAEPRTERGVVRYQVTISFELPEGVEVPVGLSGVSSVVLYEEKGVLSVPQGALYRTSKQTMVRVMNDGFVEERAVTPGDSDGSWVEVLQGLEEGDQVVVDTARVASTRVGLH